MHLENIEQIPESWVIEVKKHIEELHRANFIERMGKKDYTLFGDKPDEISNRMGWLDIASRMKSEISDLEQFAAGIRQENFEGAILLGMGGSSLAPEVFSRVFSDPSPAFRLQIVDTTDPEAISQIWDEWSRRKFLVIVSTKSGSTVETQTLMKFFMSRLPEYESEGAGSSHRPDGSRFIAITDPGSSLEAFAKVHRFRRIFLNDPDIGGRYSALSFVGLVPAALIGCDLRKLLLSAETEQMRTISYDLCDSNGITPLAFGVLLGILAVLGKNKLRLIFPGEYLCFGDWIEQLVAESTGKLCQGILPIIHSNSELPLVIPDENLTVHYTLNQKNFPLPIKNNQIQVKIPVINFEIRESCDLGSHIFLWEYATAVACYIMKINPFDQPDVESAKKSARKVIDDYRKTGKMIQSDAAIEHGDVRIHSNLCGASLLELIRVFFDRLPFDGYAGLLAYVNPLNREVTILLSALHRQMGLVAAVPVTLGYGPRYLHSTGQLHKGDSGKGCFLMIVSIPEQELEIPEIPDCASHPLPFGILKQSQAIGDYQAIVNAGRSIIRLEVPGKQVPGFLQELNDILRSIKNEK